MCQMTFISLYFIFEDGVFDTQNKTNKLLPRRLQLFKGLVFRFKPARGLRLTAFDEATR